MWFELCGHGWDANIVVFVAWEDNSSVVLNAKIKYTWQQFGMWLKFKTNSSNYSTNGNLDHELKKWS